jgi:hypothetical protein
MVPPTCLRLPRPPQWLTSIVTPARRRALQRRRQRGSPPLRGRTKQRTRAAAAAAAASTATAHPPHAESGGSRAQEHAEWLGCGAAPRRSSGPADGRPGHVRNPRAGPAPLARLRRTDGRAPPAAVRGPARARGRVGPGQRARAAGGGADLERIMLARKSEVSTHESLARRARVDSARVLGVRR